MTEVPRFYSSANLKKFLREHVEIDNENFTELLVLDIIS